MLFFFNDTPTTEIYTLSLHDALPICTITTSSTNRDRTGPPTRACVVLPRACVPTRRTSGKTTQALRSEEHTSELQSFRHLVCRLLLEKKKKQHFAIDVGNSLRQTRNW